MAQRDKVSNAVRNIITGVITFIVGIAVKIGWKTNYEWPDIIFYGALIFGGYTVYKGINALSK